MESAVWRIRIFGTRDGQGGADQVDIFVADLRANQGRKGLGKPGLTMVPHGLMLAEVHVRSSARSRQKLLHITAAGSWR